MNRKIFFAILLLAVSVQAYAQRRHNDQIIHAYPAIGFSASQIEGDELKGFKKMGVTAGVGAMVDLGRDDMWKMSVEAKFSQRGASNNTGDPYSIYDFTLNYVDIPAMLHFKDPYGGMVIGLGLSYGRLVRQPHGLLKYDPNSFAPDTSDFTFLHNDLAFVGDIRFDVWKGLKLNIRYQYSILPVKRNWAFTKHITSLETETWTNDCYNSSVEVRLLYVFGDEGNKSKYRKSKYKSYRR